MNIDIEVLRAYLGDLALQAVLLQSQIKASQDEKAKAALPPKSES